MYTLVSGTGTRRLLEESKVYPGVKAGQEEFRFSLFSPDFSRFAFLLTDFLLLFETTG